MRVTCESCGAKYNLPDAKVQGRKAKVRCKRCSASIVVDGTSVAPEGPDQDDGLDDSAAGRDAFTNGSADDGSADDGSAGRVEAPPKAREPLGFEEEEATAVMQSPLSAMRNEKPEPTGDWSVNITDDEQRQMTSEQIVDAWLTGEITDDTYVWREGMGDWVGVLQVDELDAAIRAAGGIEVPPAPVAEPPSIEEPIAEPPVTPFGSPPVAAAPPASRPPASVATPAAPLSKPRAASTARSATFDLFGPPRALERETSPARPASAPPAAPRHDPFGANENSVVFSLEALTAQTAAKEQPVDSRASEDLLTIGGMSGESPFSAPLIDPTRPPTPDPPAFSPGVLAAPGTAAEPRRKLPVWIWAVAGIAILGVGFFGGRMFMSPDPENNTDVVASATSTAAERNPDSADTAEENGAEKKDDDKTDDAEKKDDDAEKKDDDKADDAEKKDDDKSASNGSSGKGSSSGSSDSKGSSGSSGGSDSKGSSGSGSSSGSDSKGSSGGDSKGSSAPKFNVSAAKSVLGSAAASAKSCKAAGGPTGSGKVQVTFATSGRVTSANVVSGPFGGTSVGGCVARKFRAARVPAFSGSPTTVAKSFSIK